MAAELLALVYGFDHSYIVKNTIEAALSNEVPLSAYTDSRTVFNTIAKMSNTLEKRLQIDANSLRHSHHKGEIRTLGWIPGDKNPADGLTRAKLISATHPLRQVMRTNTISNNLVGWSSKIVPYQEHEKKENVQEVFIDGSGIDGNAA